MKKLIIALAVLASSSAFAAESAQSEFFYQTASGMSDGTAGLEWASGDAAGGTDVDGQRLFVSYERGLNDMWSIGATLGYLMLESDTAGTKTESSGLEDIQIDLTGKHGSIAGLRYGANLNLGIEDSETEANGDSNAATGGIVLNPYVGYEMAMDSCKFGAKLAMGLRLQNDKDDSGSEAKGGEATVISAFYEHTMNDKWALAAKLELTDTADSEDDDTGVETANGKATDITVYAPIQNVGPGTLVPSIAKNTTDDDGGDLDAMTLGVYYRMGF